MKTTTIPSLRVSLELRKQAEDILEQGETLAGFVLDALTRSIEYRKSRQAFTARGLSNAARTSKWGRKVTLAAIMRGVHGAKADGCGSRSSSLTRE